MAWVILVEVVVVGCLAGGHRFRGGGGGGRGGREGGGREFCAVLCVWGSRVPGSSGAALF